MRSMGGCSTIYMYGQRVFVSDIFFSALKIRNEKKKHVMSGNFMVHSTRLGIMFGIFIQSTNVCNYLSIKLNKNWLQNIRWLRYRIYMYIFHCINVRPFVYSIKIMTKYVSDHSEISPMNFGSQNDVWPDQKTMKKTTISTTGENPTRWTRLWFN